METQHDIHELVRNIVRDVFTPEKKITSIVLVGLYVKGVVLADRISRAVMKELGGFVSVGKLDISLYLTHHSGHYVTVRETAIPVDLKDKNVYLVNDVADQDVFLAAEDALIDYGNPSSVSAIVLVNGLKDSFTRLPVYSGVKLSDNPQKVEVKLLEVEGEDCILIE